MMILFAAYAVIVGTLVALGSWAIERLCRLFGLPTRRTWVVGLFGSLAIPGVALAIPQMTVAPAQIVGIGALGIQQTTGWVYDEVIRSMAGWDRVVAVVWIVMSGMAVMAGAAALIRLSMARRTWRRGVVAGTDVFISADVGPGVAGILKSAIVVPTWVLDQPGDRQAMIIAHEQEHIRVGDPSLLAIAALALCCMPWNPAVWWMCRRLRLAAEIDCDARVLRSGSDPGPYGDLLIDVGRKLGRTPAVVMPFSRPATNLEHRIRAMTDVSGGGGRMVRSVGFAALATAATGFAWMAPVPGVEWCDWTAPSYVDEPRAGNVVITVRATPARVIRVLDDA